MPRQSSRRTLAKQPAPGNHVPKIWTIRNATGGGVPVIELFGDVGQSREGDPWWGIEPGAGTFQEFATELKKIGPVPELRVEIHSYGGSVIVGKGMHDKLLEHPANKTAVIYGICASAATYIALACQKVQIPANSFFLIHNSTGYCYGGAEDMRHTADMLEIADDSIAALYVARTGKALEEIREIMDRDTWMTGEEAVEIGLADEVIEPITIAPEQRAAPANLHRGLLNTMPQSASAWFDMSRVSNAQPAPILDMKIRPSPLLNAATDTPPAGGGAAPAPSPSPAPAPAAAAPAAAPANQAAAPPASGPAVSVDLTTLITNAVNAAVGPLNAQIHQLQGQINNGITNAGVGGAPAPAAAPVTTPAAAPVNTTGMSAMQLINLGRQGKAKGAFSTAASA